MIPDITSSFHTSMSTPHTWPHMQKCTNTHMPTINPQKWKSKNKFKNKRSKEAKEINAILCLFLVNQVQNIYHPNMKSWKLKYLTFSLLSLKGSMNMLHLNPFLILTSRISSMQGINQPLLHWNTDLGNNQTGAYSLVYLYTSSRGFHFKCLESFKDMRRPWILKGFLALLFVK